MLLRMVDLRAFVYFYFYSAFGLAFGRTRILLILMNTYTPQSVLQFYFTAPGYYSSTCLAYHRGVPLALEFLCAPPFRPPAPGAMPKTILFEHGRLLYISGLNSSWTPGVFYKYFYNHAHCLRLEKLI
jgi:hypothetical protein